MHSFDRQACLLSACLALGLMPFAGCGDGRPRRIPVSGRVLIDGRPLEVGFIRVVPRGNRPATGALGAGGRFTLSTFEENDGCVPGRHRVAVIAKKDLSPTAIRWFAPKTYRSPATSGLEIEVGGPRDDVEILLTWKRSGHQGPFTEHFEGE
ncbi:MAG: hypothetical protein JXB10_08925 [Pirellulales bacterium]|nr:hypothetical protein [Pirellulales bacterium]